MNTTLSSHTCAILLVTALVTGFSSVSHAQVHQKPASKPAATATATTTPVVMPAVITPCAVIPAGTSATTVIRTPSVPAPSIRVGISPEGSAGHLVLDIINNAQKSIHMIAYTLTSPDIVNALIAAKQRGVNVLIVADYHVNMSREISRVALRNLVKAGIPLRTSVTYNSLHDKVLIIDNNTVQTGSFNYSNSATNRNSESLVVMKDFPEVAATFKEHWKSRWSQAQLYRVR